MKMDSRICRHHPSLLQLRGGLSSLPQRILQLNWSTEVRCAHLIYVYIDLHLYKGLVEALKLEILYEGPPDPKLKGPDLKGGFAHVYPIDLPSPREVSRKSITETSVHSYQDLVRGQC